MITIDLVATVSFEFQAALSYWRWVIETSFKRQLNWWIKLFLPLLTLILSEKCLNALEMIHFFIAFLSINRTMMTQKEVFLDMLGHVSSIHFSLILLAKSITSRPWTWTEFSRPKTIFFSSLKVLIRYSDVSNDFLPHTKDVDIHICDVILIICVDVSIDPNNTIKCLLNNRLTLQGERSTLTFYYETHLGEEKNIIEVCINVSKDLFSLFSHVSLWTIDLFTFYNSLKIRLVYRKLQNIL